jgi:uncharacterized protein YlxP (DUF503 family)
MGLFYKLYLDLKNRFQVSISHLETQNNPKLMGLCVANLMNIHTHKGSQMEMFYEYLRNRLQVLVSNPYTQRQSQIDGLCVAHLMNAHTLKDSPNGNVL